MTELDQGGDTIELGVAFESISGHEMAAAITEAETTGNMEAVWTIVDVLVAASGGASRDFVLAAVLFRLASDADDEPTQQMYLRAMARSCSPEAVDRATLGNLLSVALMRGWMVADEYDDLAARVDALPPGHRAHHLFAMVEKQVSPPAAHHVAMLEQADTDQLWRCCLTPSGVDPAGVAWVSFSPEAMIAGLRMALWRRAMNVDKGRVKLRVVFDSQAIAMALEASNCDWLVHGACVASDLDVRVELVHYGLDGADDVPTLVNNRIALVVNTLMELRRGEAHDVDELDAEQLHYTSAVLKAARSKWPATIASHAGAALIDAHAKLHGSGQAVGKGSAT